MSYLNSAGTLQAFVATALVSGLGGCGSVTSPATQEETETEVGDSGSTSAQVPTTTRDAPTATSATAGTSTATATGEGSTQSTGSTGEGSSSSGVGSSSTGQASCTKTVVLMGYWPPSNEMLRPFSTDAEQNPQGWQGENWRGLGYDVYAFFPEFPPDGDPSNDPIGSAGSVGAGDLQVDYQDTSADFWAIMDELQPHIVITHSRGGAIGWELEAIEGGHGAGGPNPALDWASDGFGGETHPTEETVDPRSWEAMDTYRDANVATMLPLEAIEPAADALGLTSVQIDQSGTSGNYLSGFLGLHGIFYAQTTPHAVAGGHIHVGVSLPVDDARALTDASVEAVLLEFPPEELECPAPR